MCLLTAGSGSTFRVIPRVFLEMRALKNIDVAFVCMNLPYTMPPEEAADAVKAFHPKIVIPYHYHGSDLAVFQKGLEGTGIEVRVLDWYPK